MSAQKVELQEVLDIVRKYDPEVVTVILVHDDGRTLVVSEKEPTAVRGPLESVRTAGWCFGRRC